jgi:hypothetical protein
MRNSLRGRYGLTSEKLVEFGLQPRRSMQPSEGDISQGGMPPALAAHSEDDEPKQEPTPV